MLDDPTRTLLAFAGHLDGPHVDAHSSARQRSWLNDAGDITPEGRELVKALRQQGDTRSCFRLFN